MNVGRKSKSSSPPFAKISDAEWTVLKVVWRLKAAKARQVVEALERETHWKPKTIHTLLSRLVKKGAVACEKANRENVFKAAIAEEKCQLAASRSFLDRVFDGKLAPFLANFLEHEKLTQKQVEELRRILEEQE